MRLDQFLVAKNLADSRARAQEMIKTGLVQVDGTVQQKPAFAVPDTADIDILGAVHPWVGRGGMKLSHALKKFSVLVTGKTCLDLGASTGGFTDVLLTNGAAKVFAVDVGHDQLHEKLRKDARVVNLEGLHAKDITTTQVPDKIDLLAVDLSFISVTKALPAVLPLLAEKAVAVVLVKPQFEAGRENIGKGGIVKDPAVRAAAVAAVTRFLQESGFIVDDPLDSPIPGGDGNREFLLHAKLSESADFLQNLA